MRVRTTLLNLALTCALGASVAGCTSDAPATPGASSQVPSSVVPSTASSAPISSARQSSMTTSPASPKTHLPISAAVPTPDIPKIATEKLPSGAAEFVRYWFISLNWAYKTSSSTLPRKLFQASCTGCARFLNNIIDANRRKGRHFVGGSLAVKTVEVAENDHRFGSTQAIDSTVYQTELKIVSHDNRTVSIDKPVIGALFRTWVRWTGNAWTIVDWRQAE